MIFAVLGRRLIMRL